MNLTDAVRTVILASEGRLAGVDPAADLIEAVSEISSHEAGAFDALLPQVREDLARADAEAFA